MGNVIKISFPAIVICERKKNCIKNKQKEKVSCRVSETGSKEFAAD
jgi:hypothetical protein